MKTFFITLILVGAFGCSFLLKIREVRSDLRGRRVAPKESISERKINSRVSRSLPQSRRSVFRDLSGHRGEGVDEALEYFRDWSGDELKALVLQIRGQISEEGADLPEGFSQTAEAALLLVSELDPKWLLESILPLQLDRHVQSYFSEWWIMGMSALVDKDVEEARKMFFAVDPSFCDPLEFFPPFLNDSYAMILDGLFASDPEKALEFQKQRSGRFWNSPDRSLMRLDSPELLPKYEALIHKITNRRDRDEWINIVTSEVWRFEGFGAALQFHKRLDPEKSIWETFTGAISAIPEYRFNEDLGEEILSYGQEVGLRDHEQTNFVSNFVGRWAWRDFGAAGKWALKLEQGMARDETMKSLAGYVIKTDAEAARLWAEEISDPKLRNEVLEKLPK